MGENGWTLKEERRIWLGEKTDTDKTIGKQIYVAAELQLADFQDTWNGHKGIGSDNAALANDVVAHRKAQSRVDNVVRGNRYVPPFGFRRKQCLFNA